MRFFLQLHDYWNQVPDGNNGLLCREPPFLCDGGAVHTSKTDVLVTAANQQVFIIAGFGSGRPYYLWETFTLDPDTITEDGLNSKGEVSWWAAGDGWQLVPPQRLEAELFDEYKTVAIDPRTNRHRGFQEITGTKLCQALWRMANTHKGDEVNEETESFCDELVKVIPTDGDAYCLRAFVRYCLGKKRGALKDLAKARTLGIVRYDSTAQDLSQLLQK